MRGRERLIQTKRETTHIRVAGVGGGGVRVGGGGWGEETQGKKQRERMRGRETGSNCTQQRKKPPLLKTASTASQSFFLSFFLSFLFCF